MFACIILFPLPFCVPLWYRGKILRPKPHLANLKACFSKLGIWWGYDVLVIIWGYDNQENVSVLLHFPQDTQTEGWGGKWMDTNCCWWRCMRRIAKAALWWFTSRLTLNLQTSLLFSGTFSLIEHICVAFYTFSDCFNNSHFVLVHTKPYSNKAHPKNTRCGIPQTVKIKASQKMKTVSADSVWACFISATDES